MYDHIQTVESNANTILDIISNNPNITIKELQNQLEKTPTFPNLTRSMIRQYVNALHKAGHIQKKGIHILTYKLLKTTPFKYTPIAWNAVNRNRKEHTYDTTH